MTADAPLPAITAVDGILVGHATNLVALTGCTVVLCPRGTVGSGDVRGGAPGTRETDLLRPGMLVEEVDAVLLAGGSAFGLAAADGVMRHLEDQGVGFDTGVARVPIVPTAVLFDLDVGDPTVRPGPAEGVEACGSAGTTVPEGTVGAGTGATVAKLRGPLGAMKGGVGTWAETDGDLVVGALAAVNAWGEVVAADGSVLAGSRIPPEGPDGDRPAVPWSGGGNTTLVVVATNARLSRERAHLLAQASHEGIAAAVSPSHTRHDGDTVFTLATRTVEADQRQVEAMAISAAAQAIRRGVLTAVAAGGVPSTSGS